MIKITIAGAAGSGKSTVAQLIAQTLDRVGIDVRLQDGKGFDVKSCVELMIDDRVARRLKAIGEKQVVEIETVQIKRGT